MAEHKVALITGANRGLGREVGRQLLERGYRVLLTARTPSSGQAAARALAGAHSDRVAFHPLDVTSAESIAALARYVAGELGTLDALVNNAGIALQGFDARVAQDTLAVNFFGALHVSQALLPRLAEGAKLVMVSSGMGELSSLSPGLRARFETAGLGLPELETLMNAFIEDVARGRHAERGWPSSAYRVSKVGLNALTRIWARELAPRGLLVNAVCPGWVRTDMGGPSAGRSVERGAEGIVWAATLGPSGPTGGFFRDGKAITW